MVRTKGKGVDPNPPAKKQKRSVFLPEEQPDDFMGLRTLNETQKNKWRNLCKRGREIQVTKFLSIPTLEKLGVNELVIELLLNAGLGGFLGKSAATYKRYTLEFLSTMERYVDDENEQCVSFNLNDVRRVIKYDVVRELFGVEMSPEDEPKKDKSVEFFYFELTGKFMQRPYVRAKEFYHPAWRFLYKALSMTFFGNGEPAQTNATSIAFMQCAVSVDKIPDWVDYFFRRCESYSGHASGNIPVGGMITLLVLHFVKKPLDSAGLIGGPKFYDHDYLLRYDSAFSRVEGSVDALWLTYGNGLRMRCDSDAVYPSGNQPRDWRMPGVVDISKRQLAIDRGEIPESEDDDEEEPHVERPEPRRQETSSSSQQGSIGQWHEMRAYLDEQNRAHTARYERIEEHMRGADLQREELADRLESVEDEILRVSRRQQQLEAYVQQPEPRVYEPVPAEYTEMMDGRAARRGQRRTERGVRFGESSRSFWSCWR